MIDDGVINEIRERADIVAVVGDYVRLKKRGSNHIGLCPFHNEKTPSFNVNPARRMYKCFGCGAAGDVFRFIMQLEGRNFPEVVRDLAERVGVEVPEQDAKAERAYREKKERSDRLNAIMEDATAFFMRQVREHEYGGMARDAYLDRNISDEFAERFRLGYAPDAWSELAEHLRERKHDPRDCEALGLIAPRRSGQGHYDRFRHRLMFPISDVHGRVVAFSGRELPPARPDEEARPTAKYINSPEGPLYTKGRILYGLYEGRVSVRRQGVVIVCEGNFDLVALHQAGFDNAVAPMGTAFTEEHAKLLRRFAEEVILLFDGDKAGRKAVRAVGPLLNAVGLTSRVVTLPQGSDPDTFLRESGSDALQQRIDAAPAMVQHLIDQAAQYAGGDPSRVAVSIAALGPVISSIEKPIERNLYIERIAQAFGRSDLDAVRQQLRQGLMEARKGRRRRRIEDERPPEMDGGAAPAEPARGPILPPMEAQIMAAMLSHEPLFGTPEAKKLDELLTSPDLRAILHATTAMVVARQKVDAVGLLNELVGNPALGWLENQLVSAQGIERDAAERILFDGVARLELQNVERVLRTMPQRISAMRREGDEESAVRLTQEFQTLSRRASELKKQAGSKPIQA